MRGLEKNRMERGHTHMRTSQLYDQIGPVGRFDENHAYGRQIISRPMRIVGPIQFWRGCMIYQQKNPAYGRHQLSRPMRIVGPIQFWRGCVIYLKKQNKKSFLERLLDLSKKHRKIAKSCPEHITLRLRCQVFFFY